MKISTIMANGMETLSKLFGGAAKVKILKLFLFNADTVYDLSQVAERAKESKAKARREISFLESMNFLKRKAFIKTREHKIRGKRVVRKIKTNGWILDESFEHLVPLQTFLVTTGKLAPREITRKLGKAGTMKLIITSGMFIHDPESRVDLLVVGDHIRQATLDSAIRSIEAETGREIRYAVFETPDFLYRLGIYDKLIRDILDFPHEKILNKLAV